VRVKEWARERGRVRVSFKTIPDGRPKPLTLILSPFCKGRGEKDSQTITN